MSLHLVDIDHLMIRTHSLAGVAEIYERLGFTVTPVRKHISMEKLAAGAGASTGTKGAATINNRHIIFKPYPGRTDVANFLEFMCIEDQLNTPPAVTQMLCFLLDSIGPKTVVCYSEDLDKTCEAMRAAGFQTAAPIPFETGWFDEARNTFVRISARPGVPVFGQSPFQFNPFETSTLEGYHYTPWTVHANGAKYMAGVSGVTLDIRRDAEFMAQKVFARPVHWIDEDIAEIRVRDLFLRIVTPAGFARLFPGLDYSTERVLPHLFGVTIAVESLGHLRDLLRGNGVHFRESTQAVCVPRQAACNTLVEFVQAEGKAS
jgi:hypothetical protein